MTTKKLSVILGITYSCLYKRLQNGWTIERLLSQKKMGSGIKAWTFPGHYCYICEPLYAQRNSYSQSRLDWFIGYLEKKLKAANNLMPDNNDAHLSLFQELKTATEVKSRHLGKAEGARTFRVTATSCYHCFSK